MLLKIKLFHVEKLTENARYVFYYTLFILKQFSGPKPFSQFEVGFEIRGRSLKFEEFDDQLCDSKRFEVEV